MGTGIIESELLVVATRLIRDFGISSTSNLKIPRRVLGLEAVHLGQLLTEGNLVQALVSTVRDTSPPKHLETGIRQFGRRIKRSAMERSKPKGETPHVLRLGTATHLIIEEGILNTRSLDQTLGRGVGFTLDENDPQNIKAFRFISPADKNAVSQLDLFGETPPPKSSVKEINLGILLPKPVTGETIANWGFGIIAETLKELSAINGGIPVTPEAFNGFLSDPGKLKPIVKIIEVCHILWGDRPGISLIRNNELNIDNNDIFRVLNWLCIAREFSETYLHTRDPSDVEKPRMNGLSEISIGSVLFSTPDREWDISGGICDLVMVAMPDLGDVRFSLEHEGIKSEFLRQSSRHRRKDLSAGKDREIKTTFPRNIFSYLCEIRRKYGLEAFNQISLEVCDLKIFGGDGGWYTGVNVDELPDPKHQKQVMEYLFLIVAQACRAEKTYNLGLPGLNKAQADGVSVTVDEVLDFGVKTGMFSRVRGFLDYYLPDRTIRISILLPSDRGGLLQWGNEFINNRVAIIKERYYEYLILKAWAGLLGEETNGDRLPAKKESELPSSLKLICGEVLEKKYLVIEDLWVVLGKEGKEFLKVNNAIYYKEDGIYVLYIEGLGKKGETARIAYEVKSGKINISVGWETVKGTMRTIRNKIGLQQLPSTSQHYFEDKIWNNLNKLGVISTELPSARSEYYFYGLDGKLQKTVPGKSIICYYDPMTGRLMIDEELARIANEKIGALATDAFGLREILEVLSTRPKHPIVVRCVDPRHFDGTPSCEWIPRDILDPTPDHFFCHRDRIFIYPSAKFEDQVSVTVALATEVRNYRPVSPSRQRIVEMVYKIATTCGARDDTAHSYVSSRGLDPKTDVGPVGFIPPKFSHALADIVVRNKDDKHGKVFWQFLKDKKMLRLNIYTILANLEHEMGNQLSETTELLAEYKQRFEVVESSLDFLSPDHKKSILDVLTPEKIEELQRRGLVGKNKDGFVRFGGRVEQLLFWFDEDGRLVPSNFNSREIPQLAEGDRFFNMRIKPKRTKAKFNKDGELLNPTPKGIWLPDPEKSVTEITLSGEVVVTEGWINAASLGRFNSKYKNRTLAMCGSGTRTLAAILKKLNVQVVYLATDFDYAGHAALKRAAAGIEAILPEIEIRDIRELLPKEIRELVPTVETLEALKPTLDIKNPTIATWGKDLNDVLVRTEVGNKYAYQSS